MATPSTEALPLPINPWKVSSIPEPCSLAQVMDEELANSLTIKEDITHLATLDRAQEDIILDVDSSDCSSDLLLAEMLQMEYDKEHDEILKREESKFNRQSKVSISFANYRTIPDCLTFDSDSSETDDDGRNWDSFEEGEKNSPNVGKSGFTKHGSTITTKHDATICGRRNACRVMGFPPGFLTGDAGGFDMKLSNKVYNRLKVHSMTEEKRNKRIHDKVEKSTAEQVLDPKTRLIIYKMINNSILENVNGIVSTGKESVVLHADGRKLEEQLVPAECALKVYKTTLNEFKTRDKYIRDDYRFKDRFNKQNPRKIIRMWAEKEMHNLNRMQRAGIPCPQVVYLKKHILVMSFIGKDATPAPKLKDAVLSLEQLKIAYEQIVEIMKKLYKDCNLVHADLSEYNLLWHEDKVWVIDVSQSVEPSHPQALEFLYRDCGNIKKFFEKMNVSDIASVKDLFLAVSGIDLPGEGTELLSQIQDFERNEEILTHGASEKYYSFDYLFNLSKTQKMDSPTAQQVALPIDPVPSITESSLPDHKK